MSQDEIKAAIASQEEYIKRSQSCGGVVGKAHRFQYRGPAGRIPWRECVGCGVTETKDDYERKMQHQG